MVCTLGRRAGGLQLLRSNPLARARARPLDSRIQVESNTESEAMLSSEDTPLWQPPTKPFFR